MPYAAPIPDRDGQRCCRACGLWKDLASDYYLCNRGRNRMGRCKVCYNARGKLTKALRRLTDPAAERWTRIAWRYGLTEAAFFALLAEQLGRCAICRKRLVQTDTHVDHDHETNTVRGLLCQKCNRGLGHFDDSEMSLANAITYLRSHKLDLELTEILTDPALEPQP